MSDMVGVTGLGSEAAFLPDQAGPSALPWSSRKAMPVILTTDEEREVGVRLGTRRELQRLLPDDVLKIVMRSSDKEDRAAA